MDSEKYFGTGSAYPACPAVLRKGGLRLGVAGLVVSIPVAVIFGLELLTMAFAADAEWLMLILGVGSMTLPILAAAGVILGAFGIRSARKHGCTTVPAVVSVVISGCYYLLVIVALIRG